MMSLEEAIQHCEEVAEEQGIKAKSNLIEIDKIKADGVLRLYDAEEYESCMKCAEEHRQLAEWLRELKAYEKVRRILSQKRIATIYGEVVLWSDIKRVLEEVNADDENFIS